MKNQSMKLNFLFNTLKTLMTILFPAISFPYASRILGVKQIGAVQYSSSIVSYFALFAALGISVYSVREGAKLRNDRKKLSKFSSEMLLINLISTGISYTVLLLFICLNFFNGYVILILVSSLLIVFTTLSVEWLYQIMEDYAYISLRSLIIQIISLILLFTFVKSKEDYLVYAFIIVFSTSGYFFMNLISSRRFVDFFRVGKLELSKHIKPILVVFGVSVASSIYLNIDVVVLGAIFGDYEVGLYTVAVKINVIVRGLISSVGIVVLPRLTNYLYNHKYKEYNQMLRSGVSLNLMLAIPCAIGLFMLSKETILLVSGAEYLGATFASRILAANLIFSTLDGLLYYQVLIPYNLEKKACFGTIFGAVVNLILNFLLVFKFSYNGVAVATLIAEVLVFIMFLYILKEKINIKYLFSDVYKFILAGLPIIPICYFGMRIGNGLVLSLLLVIILSATVYFILLYFLKVSLVHEGLRDIKKLVKRK